MSKVTERVSDHIPPAWCSQICANAMNDLCVEQCAPKRNCMWFDPKVGMNLPDMPAFPWKEWLGEMTKEERAVSTAFYMFKIVQHEKGVTDDRPILYRPRNRRHIVPEPVTPIPADPTEEIPPCENQPAENNHPAE